MPSGRIWKVFATSAERLIAKARIVRVKASRKQRGARRGPVEPHQRIFALLPGSMIMVALPWRTLNSISC